MSGYYEGIDTIATITEQGVGDITVPRPTIEGAPYRLANLPLDEVAFAGRGTVYRDQKTDKLLIDTHDVAMSLPTTEWELRTNPAVMRVAGLAGERAVTGYVVDYRNIGLPSYVDTGLEDGSDSVRFSAHQEQNGTVFPLGVLFNTGGEVEYRGLRVFRDSAESMMHRVDAMLAKAALTPHAFTLPAETQDVKYAAVQRPQQAAEVMRVESRAVPTTLPKLAESALGLAGSLFAMAILGGKPKQSS